MNVLQKIKETVIKKSKLYYFAAGAFSVLVLIYFSTNLSFTNITYAGITGGELGAGQPARFGPVRAMVIGSGDGRQVG